MSEDSTNNSADETFTLEEAVEAVGFGVGQLVILLITGKLCLKECAVLKLYRRSVCR